MTKISNQRAYIPDEEINGLDYLPGTDFDQALKTVNFRVQDLGMHYNQVNGVRNFDFNFYAHSGSNPKPLDGYFYSNDNEKNPNNIEYFIFSKVTASRKIVGSFFENIVSNNPFDVVISQKVDVNSTFYFRIDSVESFTHYYKLNVSEIYFPEVNELQYTLSYNNFYLKSEGISIHNQLNGLNEGDFIHLTAAEKEKFDNLPEIFPQNLQEVTDGGSGTTNEIQANGIGTPYMRLYQGEYEVELKSETLTNTRELFAPDENGTIATKEWVNDNLPSVPSFADQTETNAGIVSDKAIAPNTLAGWWVYVKTLAQTFSQKITFSLGALFSPQVAPTHERGRVYFDDVNDCLTFMDSISGTSVQVGYETLMRARNNTGDTIPNGALVYISGAIGQNPTIALAQSNTEPTSEIIGVATHNIANNTVGKVCVFGLVNDVNTSAFNDGDFLYLSSSVAGGLTTTPPASPNFVVSVGVVEHAHPTQGKILVKPQRALSNNNTLGTSQKVSVTENVVKTNLDSKLDKVTTPSSVYATDALGNQEMISKDSFQNALGFTPENLANKENTTLDTSTTKYPTNNLVKTNLDLKQNTLVSGTTIKTIEGQSILGSGNIDLNKNDVGLSNVDNTSDLNKPISTATQTALDLKLDKVSTTGVERVYTINADGSQATKPTSDFGTVKGTGTTNFLSKFTGSGNIGNSQIFDNGTNVGIATTTPSQLLHVNGRALVNQFEYTRAIEVSNTNLDNLTNAGFYNGTQLTNAPGIGWYFITVERYTSDANWVKQTATSFGASNTGNITWTRTREIGTWQPWKRLIDTVAEGGTTNYVPKFTASGTLGNSQIFDNGTNVGIGTTSPGARLDVRAQGALATNIVFRVRNSTDTGNFLVVNGAGDVYNNGRNGVNTNTFFGENVGRNTTGFNNTAIGQNALQANTTGSNNTALGTYALRNNTTGIYNTAIGASALLNNTTGIFNTAIGGDALFNNTTGNNNTAIGVNALLTNTTGTQNTAIGIGAGRLISNGSNNTITDQSIFIGHDTRALNNNETNQIVIGHQAIGLGSNSVVLGNSSITITQLRGQVIMGSFASNPTGIEGAIYYNSTTKKHYGFDGTTWNALY